MNDITCPFCQKRFELSAALKHQIEESVSKKNQEEYEAKLEKIKIEISQASEKRLRAEFEIKNKSSKLQLEDAENKRKAAEEKLLESEKERIVREEKIK